MKLPSKSQSDIKWGGLNVNPIGFAAIIKEYADIKWAIDATNNCQGFASWKIGIYK